MSLEEGLVNFFKGFTVAYREDDDLEILKYASRDDLDVLVNYLTKDSDGTERLTEELTMSEEYKRYAPNHEKYWHLIAAEIQCFGANTFATIFRGGKGVLYREVLEDVCDKLDVSYNPTDITAVVEMKLLENILEKSLEQLDFKQRQEIVKELNLKTTDFSKQGVIIALQTAIKMGGFTPYRLAVIVANSVAKLVLGRGLSFATNAALTRTIGIMSGPIGWAVSGAWTLMDLAGPAYRVTIPSVIQVSFIRAKLEYE